MPYPPLSSALILINTASPSRMGEATMSGNVQEVLKKLRTAADEHVDLIHCLLGPIDMIAHVHAADFKQLLDVIDTKVLPLKNERHNYIASAEPLIVRSSQSRERFSGVLEKPKQLNAWVFANTNTSDPDLGFRLLENKSIFYVAHVIGRYDVVLLIRADTLDELMSAIDQTLRTKNYFVTTDTRMVLM